LANQRDLHERPRKVVWRIQRLDVTSRQNHEH
jgi:hypothetical protein